MVCVTKPDSSGTVRKTGARSRESTKDPKSCVKLKRGLMMERKSSKAILVSFLSFAQNYSSTRTLAHCQSKQMGHYFIMSCPLKLGVFLWLFSSSVSLVCCSMFQTSNYIIPGEARPSEKRLRGSFPHQRRNTSTDSVVNATGRIIGGAMVESPERFPYYVSLVNGQYAHVCGGSLIAPDIVLTAAHCK